MVRRVALASLRRAVAVVDQDGFLFSRTIADNVALGRPGASSDAIRAGVGLYKSSARHGTVGGVSSRVSAHSLRRAWATIALNEDAQPIDVVLDSALLAGFQWRNIGPDRGGRSIAVSGVVDVIMGIFT